MLQSRRGFLIGAGSLLTTAFVKDARSFIRTNGRPLLAPPTQVLQTLYWYDSADDGYLLTLGEWTMDPPPAPSWREFFIKEAIRHETEDEIENICSEYGIEPEDFDDPVEEWYWAQRFEIEDGPCAKAHRLLRIERDGPRDHAIRPGSNFIPMPVAIVQRARCRRTLATARMSVTPDRLAHRPSHTVSDRNGRAGSLDSFHFEISLSRKARAAVERLAPRRWSRPMLRVIFGSMTGTAVIF